LAQDFAKFSPAGVASPPFVALAMPTDGGAFQVLLGRLRKRAINSSNLESKSFRMGDLLDIL